MPTPQLAAEEVAAPPVKPRPRPLVDWLPPLLIALAALFTFIHFGHAHPIGTYATETDFYHLFAPDAERLAAGQFPENDFQGPGYPALIAAVTKLTGDTFTAGKWVSIISAALLVLLIYALFARLFGRWVGVGAALLFPVGAQIPQFSISATTDINFLLLCFAALCLFTSASLSPTWRVVLTAVVTSLAYLSRYNGLFLLAAFLFAVVVLNVFERAWKDRALLAGLFLLVFLATASPWLVANYKHNGSPFYNVNYLNIATEFYPELVNGNVFQDGTRPLREKFHSFGDVLRYNPQRILTHYPANLYESFVNTIKTDLVVPPVAVLGVVGFALALCRKRRDKAVLTLLAAMSLYFLLMGLSHWETRYYFFLGVAYGGLAVYAVVEAAKWLSPRLALRLRPALGVAAAVVVAAMFAHSFVYAKQDVTTFLESHPLEVLAAVRFIAEQHAAPHTLRIVARKPHLAYLTHQEWVFLPPVKSPDELRAWLAANPVDYVAIGARELKQRKELKPLGDPQKAPAWLAAAWVSEKPLYILYRPCVEPADRPAAPAAAR